MQTSKQAKREIKNALERARRAMRRDDIAAAERAERDALKRRMIEHRGGACTRCTRTLADFGHVAVFDFHHRVPAEKRFSFSGNYSRSWEVLEAELVKCDLICACCHRIIEAIAVESDLRESGDGDSPVAKASRRGRPPQGTERAVQAAPDERTRATIRAAMSYVEGQETERRRVEVMRCDQTYLFDFDMGIEADRGGVRAAA